MLTTYYLREMAQVIAEQMM